MADTSRIMLFDSSDTYLGDLAPDDVFGRKRIEAINGEHSLTITTSQILAKGTRLLTVDDTGKWREYVVSGQDANHSSGKTAIGSYYCVWSIQHDLMGVTCDKMPGVQNAVNAATALAAALSNTKRWTAGAVTVTSTGGASMWQRSAWEALSVLIDTWGGEVDAEITVGSTGVVKREACLYSHLGSTDVTRRFDYGADLVAIRRKVAEDPIYARIVPLGAGYTDDANSTDRRRVTIESLTDGNVQWLQNDDVAELVRLPDGSGGWEYPTRFVIYDGIETPEELLAVATADLDTYTTPKVTYTASVLQLDKAGADIHGLALGDDFDVVDKSFDVDGGIRIRDRAIKLEVNEMDEHDIVVTLGDVAETFASSLAKISGKVDTISNIVANQGATFADYLNNIIDNLNAEINATDGYTYIVAGRGIVTYDVAVSDPTVGAEASQVTEMRGGTLRFANGRTSAGDWDWKTVLISGHIATDMITSGNITAGYIGNSTSGNYWNLDTGEFRLVTTASMGGRTVEEVLAGVDATITDVDVEYAESQSNETAPSTGWDTECPTWREGYYIWQRTKTTTATGTTYSDAACISGREGVDGTSVTISSIQWTVGTSGTSAPATGWQASVPSVDQGKWLWCKTTYSDGSTAYTCSYQGTDGEDGTSVAIQSATKSGDTTTVVLVETDASGEQTTSTLTITDGADGTNGTAGANGYIHTAWANSADGSTDFSTSVSTGKTYLGVYTDNTATDSSDPSAYSWSLIKGSDGVGINSTTITYGTSASASTQPTSWQSSVPTVAKGQWLWVKTEYTYTDSSNKTVYSKSYAGTDGEDGKSVAVQSASKSNGTTTVVLVDTDGNTTTLTINDGEDGDTGSAGANGYVHTAWATSADGSTGFSTSVSTGKTYLGVYTDNTATDSSDPSAYSWSLIKGSDGVGINSTTITYGTSASASTQPTSWQSSVPTVAKGQWLWVKTEYTYTDSSNKTVYSKSYAGTDGEDGKSVAVQSASKSNGTTTVVLVDTDGNTTTLTINDGEDGDTGSAGANGYVHTAWATSADGSTGFSTSVSTGKTYLGVYTDNTAADSQTYSDYSWSLIKGADGDDGVGISSVVPQYYLSTSSTAQTGGSWSASEPTWVSGKYIWTRSMVTWADGTSSPTDPVLASALNTANETAADAKDTADTLATMVRSYGAGVLVCKTNQTVGALVNANGSFDVVNVTWSSGTPTAGTVLATFGSYIEIGSSTHIHMLIDPVGCYFIQGTASNPYVAMKLDLDSIEFGLSAYDTGDWSTSYSQRGMFASLAFRAEEDAQGYRQVGFQYDYSERAASAGTYKYTSSLFAPGFRLDANAYGKSSQSASAVAGTGFVSMRYIGSFSLSPGSEQSLAGSSYTGYVIASPSKITSQITSTARLYVDSTETTVRHYGTTNAKRHYLSLTDDGLVIDGTILVTLPYYGNSASLETINITSLVSGKNAILKINGNSVQNESGGYSGTVSLMGSDGASKSVKVVYGKITSVT